MKPIWTVGRFLLLLSCLSAIFWMQACVSPALLAPPSPPYSSDEMKAILNQVAAQENLVQTLFCTGKLTSRQGEREQEANITIVGRRTPFQVKIEIIHPWGPPIADLLLDESRFTLVFFPEKRIFLGPVRKGTLKRSFPIPLDPSAVWAFIRGYPVIPGYKKAVSPKKGVISLLDGRDVSLRRLDFDLSTLRPETCYFPAIRMTQYYEAFEKDDAIEFAQKVVLKETSQGRTLILRIRHALFNPHLPPGVFRVKKPKGFRTIVLSR